MMEMSDTHVLGEWFSDEEYQVPEVDYIESSECSKSPKHDTHINSMEKVKSLHLGSIVGVSQPILLSIPFYFREGTHVIIEARECRIICIKRVVYDGPLLVRRLVGREN